MQPTAKPRRGWYLLTIYSISPTTAKNTSKKTAFHYRQDLAVNISIGICRKTIR
jgi:hypothetical protein